MASYELFSRTEVLGRMAMGRMLAGLSSRRYPVGMEPVGQKHTARSTSKSAVSRRFVTATETAMGELLAADLSGLDSTALMIDGVHFGDHVCVVALGIDIGIGIDIDIDIDIDGTKHPLGLAEGSTENTTVVTDLCVSSSDLAPPFVMNFGPGCLLVSALGAGGAGCLAAACPVGLLSAG